MHIDNKFTPNEIVYLITDPDQFERLVTRIIIAINLSLLYELSCGTETSLHYAEEISSKQNTAIVLGLSKVNRE